MTPGRAFTLPLALLAVLASSLAFMVLALFGSSSPAAASATLLGASSHANRSSNHSHQGRSATRGGAGGSPSPGVSLQLLNQTSWVRPGSSFNMRVLVTGTLPARSPSLSVTLYQRLTSESAFQASIQAPATSTIRDLVIDRIPPVPLSSIPVDPAGGLDLFMPVATLGHPLPPSATFGLTLPCLPVDCGGVYPMRLTLEGQQASGSTRELASMLTQLVYVDPPPSTTKLRLALVIPLSLPPPVAGPSGSLDNPAPAVVSSLEHRLATLASAPGIALSLALDPSTMVTAYRLASSAPKHSHLRSLPTYLAAVASAPSHEVLRLPFVPVSPSTLGAAGLFSDFEADMAEGAAVFATAGIHPGEVTWLGRGLTDASLGYLESLGLRGILVDPSSVGGPSGTLTATQPFELSDNPFEPSDNTATPATGSVDSGSPTAASLPAVFANRGLQEDMARAAGQNGVLAAHWLLANLALIYFEQPNLVTVRGVAALPPTSWQAGRGFLSTLLTGLARSPVVEPVTLSSFFAEVPEGTDGNPASRPLLSIPPTPGFPAAAARRLRDRTQAFASATGNSTVLTALLDDRLAAESSRLDPLDQRAALRGAEAALFDQYAGLVLASERTITFTSTTGRLPVTILSTSPYPIRAVLSLKSDGLVFLHGAKTEITLDRRTNATYFDVRTRSPGDFPVAVTLTTPTGGLLMLHGRLTVRSRAVSAVGIALSAGALAILLAWWLRTLWRGSRRRGAHVMRHR